MREVIIHAGTPKTGSTAIQQSFQGFDDGRTMYSAMAVMHTIAIRTVFSRDPQDWAYWRSVGETQERVNRAKRKFLKILEDEVSRKDRERLVISGENISSMKVPERRRMIRFFHERGLGVKTVFYVREPQSFFRSSCQQRIKDGGSEVPHLQLRYIFRIAPFLRLLQQGDVIVRVFDRSALTSGDVVSDFAGVLGVELDPALLRESNETLNEPAIRLMYLLNRTSLATMGSPVLLQTRRKFIEAIRSAYAGGKELDNDLFDQIGEIPADELEFLRKNFGIDFGMPFEDRQCVTEKRAALHAYLSDTSDIDRTPVQKLLDHYGVARPASDDLPDHLVALFEAIRGELLREA